jgi:hypothetical protein
MLGIMTRDGKVCRHAERRVKPSIDPLVTAMLGIVWNVARYRFRGA